MSMFLEELTLRECDCIHDISPELLPRARELNVSNCHNLSRFLIPTATETLVIGNCKNVEILSVACGGTQMTSLRIDGCLKLKWLPERMQELLPSLKKLDLYGCPEIESFPEGGLPFNLQQLHICYCKKLVNGRKEWRLQRLLCLTELSIMHDGSDEEIVGGENWELPSSIQSLAIVNLKTLSSQHLKRLVSLQYLYISNVPQIQSMLEQGQFSHLTSLQSLQITKFPNLQSLPESALPSSLSQLGISLCPNLQSLPESALPSSLSQLTISNCPNLQSLPESALPSSLSQLKISDCHNLQSLPESALPSSLSQLIIFNCSKLQSLPESALPSSLSQLKISYCRNLQSLPESALPSSLSQLEISHCPKLQSLPLKGMPSSLSKLYIHDCPLLKPLLEFDKGEYWPNIAQFPTIMIDRECM